MTATTLPNDLDLARDRIIGVTGLAEGDVGALPNASHKAGGGYHCGVQDIINIGKYPTNDYSTRQVRDRVGGNACAAIDVGDNWPRGGRAAWLRFNNWLVEMMVLGDPALAALRGVNFSPDGTACKRYDQNNRAQGIINSTDTVYMHTHLEWWRNTAGTQARVNSVDRIVLIMQAAVLNNKGMITGMSSEWHTGEPNGPFISQGNPGYAGQQRDTAMAFTWEGMNNVQGDVAELKVMVQALTDAHVDVDDEALAQVRAEARAGALEGIRAGVDDIVHGVLAGLPEPQVPAGDGGEPAYSLAQLETAVRAALGQADVHVTFDEE